MQGKIGHSYSREIDGLGEFNFIFRKSDWKDSKKTYQMTSFFNPENYGKVDFIIGYEVDDILSEIESFEEDFDYFIDGARVSCLCNLEYDDEGVYTDILMDYFGYTEEEIEEELNKDRVELNSKQCSKSEQLYNFVNSEECFELYIKPILQEAEDRIVRTFNNCTNIRN